MQRAALRLSGAQESLPLLFRAAGDGQPAVFAGAGVDAVRGSAGVAVAHSALLTAVSGVVQEQRGYEVHRSLELGQVEVDALSGATAAVQGSEYRGNGELGDDEVGVGAVGIDGRTIGPAGDVGEPHQRREDRTEAGLPFHGSAPSHH